MRVLRSVWFISVSATVLCAVAGAPAVAQEAEQEESEEVVVEATRAQRRVQDEPIRVEVIGREEIEEKILMVPGNVSMLVAETGGVRVQVIAPTLGAANVRMQGMSGRYTQLLADGLPLYGGQSIGILQIPPTDIGQVEVIKGAASALYGSSALGGVVNLVSRRPGESAEGEMLLNITTRDGQDVTAYAATPLGGGWSGSFTGGAHRQSLQDLDSDGWIDTPEYERWTARPRLFWEGANGARVFATFGAMGEDRIGGTLPGRTVPDGLPYAVTLHSQRRDGGVAARIPLEGVGFLDLRGAVMRNDHDHRFGVSVESDRHETALAEATLSNTVGATSWLVGIAYQEDKFASAAFPVFDYDYTAPALFAQLEQEIGEDVTLAGSVRYDDHSAFGAQVSPRLSFLWRPGLWRVRASFGQGFYAPTPFVEEIEAAGLSRLEPLSALKAETARTASFDVGYRVGPLETGVTLFVSDIDDAVQVDAVDADTVRLINASGVTRTRGGELLLRYRIDKVTLTGSYVHVDAREPDGAGRRKTPTTPRHTAGFVAMWEDHNKGRVGFEAYYTGAQDLEDNPFRATGKPYFEIGLLGEVALGDTRIFLNLENLLDVRQTNYDRLVRPTRAADGRWTVDAWAPIDGFVVNAGLRYRFGGDGEDH